MPMKRADDPVPVFGVWRMAAALAVAAFLGGALGLVWQSAGLGGDDDTSEQAPEQAAVQAGED
jgi:hypothetical protein